MTEVRPGVGRCPRCEAEKPVDAFPVDSSKANGRATLCRDCDNAKAKAYYRANRERKLAAYHAARTAQGARRCATCDEPATSSIHRYCDSCRAKAHQRNLAHRRQYDRRWRKGRNYYGTHDVSTAERGYGNRHRKLRKALAPWVALGLMTCARCDEPIAPTAKWHLDHTDDRTGYIGASHERCNCATSKPSQVHRTPRPREERRLELIAKVYGISHEPTTFYAA